MVLNLQMHLRGVTGLWSFPKTAFKRFHSQLFCASQKKVDRDPNIFLDSNRDIAIVARQGGGHLKGFMPALLFSRFSITAPVVSHVMVAYRGQNTPFLQKTLRALFGWQRSVIYFYQTWYWYVTTWMGRSMTHLKEPAQQPWLRFKTADMPLSLKRIRRVSIWNLTVSKRWCSLFASRPQISIKQMPLQPCAVDAYATSWNTVQDVENTMNESKVKPKLPASSKSNLSHILYWSRTYRWKCTYCHFSPNLST